MEFYTTLHQMFHSTHETPQLFALTFLVSNYLVFEEVSHTNLSRQLPTAEAIYCGFCTVEILC